MQNAKSVAIVLNAPYLRTKIEEKHVICADGGKKLVDGTFEFTIVGDFDSLDVNQYEDNVELITVPVEKNFTDGELALRVARDKGYTSVNIYGAEGGRLDHIYANLSLLKIADDLNLNAKLIINDGYVIYRKVGRVDLNVDLNTTISVLPYTSSAVVSNSIGLKYPYDNLTLTKSDTIGISNISIDDKVSFNILDGDCLIFIISTKNDEK